MQAILVIDDEKSILNLFQDVLTRFGYSVETATNGGDGIDKFDKNKFDLVITDIQMPGIDGNEVARHIKKSRRGTVPVIGMSGTPWLFQQNNFDSVIEKPCSIHTLLENIKNLIHEKQCIAL